MGGRARRGRGVPGPGNASGAGMGVAPVVKPARTGWDVQLLGSFAVNVDGVRAEAGGWRLRKAKLLVAMLALAPGQRRHREQVLDRLWPDFDRRDLWRACEQYARRDRRFGAATDAAKEHSE